MSEKQTKQTTDETWHEVGKQFQTLGESLAEAFRTAWESEETRRHVQNMQTGLKAMVDKLDQTLEEISDSPQGEKIRLQAEKAAESIRTAGEQTWQEARPHLLSALTQLNTELQKMIGRLKQKEPTPEVPAAEIAPEEE
jgi:ElaB/YqjD/DUF883 family membrane-anchored ribosome-binding protein